MGTNITSEKSFLKNTASMKAKTGEVKDPKTLFKPEAESCNSGFVEKSAFDDSYPRRKKNFFDKLGFNEGPITYLVDYMEEAFEKYSKNIQKELKPEEYYRLIKARVPSFNST